MYFCFRIEVTMIKLQRDAANTNDVYFFLVIKNVTKESESSKTKSNRERSSGNNSEYTKKTETHKKNNQALNL